MHDDVLILPDGGAGFMETVRLSALYADKMHVFSPTDEFTLLAIQALVEYSFPDPAFVDENWKDLLEDFPQHAEFLKKHPASSELVIEDMKKQMCEHPAKRFLLKTIAYRDELQSLQREGVLISVANELVAMRNSLGDAATANLNSFMSLSGASTEWFPKSLVPEDLYSGESALADPSITFLIEALLVSLLNFGNSLEKLPQELIDKVDSGEANFERAGAAIYFLAAAFYAAQRGCVGVTSQVDARECFDRCLQQMTAGNPKYGELLARRNRIKAQLGEAILQETVPDVSRMPLDEILEIRRKREPELQSFREGLNQLAAEMDPNLQDGELQAAIDSKIHGVVKPALGEMRRAIEELRISAFDDVARDAITAGGVPFIIAATAGVPTDMSAGMGAAGIAAQKLYDFTIGRAVKQKKILAANQWSVLFRLQNS